MTRRTTASCNLSSRLGWGSCLLGGMVTFVWIPGTLWQKFLPSYGALVFLPLFGSALASGWLSALTRLRKGREVPEGTVRSQASITGCLTAVVACFAANAANGFRLPLEAVAMFTGFGLLPCALLATMGAGIAYRFGERRAASGDPSAGRRRVFTLVISAVLPAMGVLVWPAVYVAGRFLEKPTIVATPVPPPMVVAAPPPQPRYVKPEGFDAANAWKRVVSHEATISNIDSRSAIALSRDERRLAFVTRDNGRSQLVVRQLYDPGPDYSLALDGGIVAMAWSPDDQRIVVFSSRGGAFWVCVPESGHMVRLPIPVLERDPPMGLVWWRDESVLVYGGRGEPALLSLDTLRITPAHENADWAALPESGRAMISQAAFVPDMGRTATATFSFVDGIDDASRTLAIKDDESLYARVVARVDRNLASMFPNRDGTMLFLMEPGRLRILCMGLRESPSLRFIAESKVGFPATPTVKAALENQAVRAAVVSPIINPLNGNTVAGDPTAIKGYARFIAASDKTCSVWIEQESQPIQEGDVLIALSALQEGDEYSVAPKWWAVLKSADEVQSIPRRAGMPDLLPSDNRALKPLPEPASPPPQVTASLPSSPQTAPRLEPPPKTTASPPKASKTPAMDVIPQPPRLTDEERLCQFIIEHSACGSRGDIDGVLKGYGDLIDVGPNQSMTRAELGEVFRRNRLGTTTLSETPILPIKVNRLTGNRYAISYVVRTEIAGPAKPRQFGELRLDLEVLMTSQGPKIFKQRELTLRVQTTGGRR